MTIKKIAYLLLSLFFISCGQKTNLKKEAFISYANPLLTSDSLEIKIADPFVYRGGDTYYLTGTTGSAESQGFDYYTSTDMVTWEYKGPLFRKSDKDSGNSAFWAPEVLLYQGKYYMTYSSLHPDKGSFLLSSLAVSDNPEGPFKELYNPWFNLGFSAIDCHIFIDDNESKTPYLYFSKNGSQDGYAYGENYVVELTDDLSKFVGEPQLVSRASQEWEKVNWDKNRCNEGVFVFKNEDTYYMTYSANDTGYEHYGVGVATAKHPLGPWTKNEDNPLMTTNLEEGISSPGHSSMAISPNGEEMYIVYHRHADPHGERPSWDRVVCIDKVWIDKSGKLCVNGPSSTPQEYPR